MKEEDKLQTEASSTQFSYEERIHSDIVCAHYCKLYTVRYILS